MTIKFSPNGNLDISTDPQDLPAQESEGNISSGAMTRCTNLHLDHMGIASTRRGSLKVSANAMADLEVKSLIEQAGNRYAFAGTGIYENEAGIASDLTDDEWGALLYNAYTSLDQSVFATNGTDRKRISGSTVSEWGIDAPVSAPGCLANFDWNYTSLLDPPYLPTWVLQFGSSVTHVTKKKTYIVRKEVQSVANYFNHFTTTAPDGTIYECVHDWEAAHLDNPSAAAVSPSDSTTYKIMNWFELGLNDDTSVYQVRYTYCRKNGDVLEYESNPSPVGYAFQSSGMVLTFTASTDPQVTHFRIYRTLADQGDFYFMAEIQASIDYQTFTIQDTELGALIEIDHYRPPVDGHILFGPAYSGSLFLAVGNNLYYSKPKQPEYWPADYAIEVCPIQLPLIAGCIFSGSTFVANAPDIFQIQGTGPSSFFPLKMGAQCGTLSKQCFLPVVGQGIFHLSSEGIYLFKLGSDVNISEDNFSPVFHGEARGSMPGMNLNFKSRCWMFAWRGKFYFGYPGGTDPRPRDVIVTELSSGRSVHYQYPFAIRCLTVDQTNQRLLAGCTDGFIRIIEEVSITDDDGVAVSWDIETKAFSQFKKIFPRYARYDVDLVSETSLANGFIKLNDAVVQTHPITEARQIKKRHVATSTGDRLSIEISGSGPVDIYAAEVE